MNTFTVIIAGLSLTFLFLAAIAEFATVLAMGSHIDPRIVDSFLDAHEESYRSHKVSGDMLYGGINEPFIAHTMPTLTAKWYIHGYGTIWRWSKASKRLDALHAELYRPDPKKSLSDLI